MGANRSDRPIEAGEAAGFEEETRETVDDPLGQDGFAGAFDIEDPRWPEDLTVPDYVMRDFAENHGEGKEAEAFPASPPESALPSSSLRKGRRPERGLTTE